MPNAAWIHFHWMLLCLFQFVSMFNRCHLLQDEIRPAIIKSFSMSFRLLLHVHVCRHDVCTNGGKYGGLPIHSNSTESYLPLLIQNYCGWQEIQLAAVKRLHIHYFILGLITVDSRYLEIEGTLKNSSRYPYFDISDL